MRKIFLLLFAVCFVGSVGAQDAPVLDTIIVSSEGTGAAEFDSLPSQIEAITVRGVDDSVIANMKSRDEYWYADSVPQRQAKKKVTGTGGSGSNWLGSLLWVVLVVVFIGIITWFLASSNISLFRGRQKVLEDEELEISEENLFTIQYEREIEKAVANENYRLATRLWYLYCLKILVDKNRIQFKPGRTNSDYLGQLYGSHLYKDFSRLTRNFEYVWYGGFTISPSSYAILQKDFQQFKSGLI